jgi:hypothetical protein
MGYHPMITYTQHGESGASVRAIGMTAVAELRPRPGWTTPSRPRTDRGVDRIARVRWEICTNEFAVSAMSPFLNDETGVAA